MSLPIKLLEGELEAAKLNLAKELNDLEFAKERHKLAQTSVDELQYAIELLEDHGMRTCPPGKIDPVAEDVIPVLTVEEVASEKK